MFRTLVMLVLIPFFFGCSHTYKYTNIQSPLEKINPSESVVISTPEDGWYGATQYKNSGRMTANAVRSAFSKYAGKVDIITGCIENDCLKNIDNDKYDYFVKPIILHWEDRATEWSGKPDRIEIQLIVFDTKDKSEVANSSYKGKSKWATFGGDNPQDLLAEPTDEYVRSLYY